MIHKAEFINEYRQTRGEATNGVIEKITHDGTEYTGTDKVGKLCRELGAGTLEIYRDDMLCMTVDVEQRALKSLSENDRGFSLGKYKPFPDTLKYVSGAQA